jgi:hypothetical protein
LDRCIESRIGGRDNDDSERDTWPDSYEVDIAHGMAVKAADFSRVEADSEATSRDSGSMISPRIG